MAIFTCYVPTNNFGKGSPPPFDFSGGSFYFELDSPKYYELFGGSFHILRTRPQGATSTRTASMTMTIPDSLLGRQRRAIRRHRHI